MAFTEIRNINGKNYYYRVISIRKGNKVSKKRVYLGKDLLNSEIAEKEREADKKMLPQKIKANKEVEKIKSKITKVLKKNKVIRAGIFGSYSRGEQKKDSDIDIAVEINDNDMSLLGFIALKMKLEDVLKKKVDLVEYSVIKPLIKDNILKEEVRII
ncbi:MAG: nucleotidyltransferase family protein [Nanoarchaeota archaeon]